MVMKASVCFLVSGKKAIFYLMQPIKVMATLFMPSASALACTYGILYYNITLFWISPWTLMFGTVLQFVRDKNGGGISGASLREAWYMGIVSFCGKNWDECVRVTHSGRRYSFSAAGHWPLLPSLREGGWTLRLSAEGPAGGPLLRARQLEMVCDGRGGRTVTEIED